MKKTKGFGLVEIIIIIVVTALVTSVTTGVIMLNNTNIEVDGNIINVEKDKDLQEFISVYKTILDKYYDNNIDKKGMLNAAEEAMLDFLGDKYTTYLNDKEYQNIIDDLSGTYKGIGIYIELNKVVDVIASSPAEKAGIQKGDIITKINGTDVTNADGSVIKELIKNDDDKSISLEINRNEEILNFYVNKEKLVNPSISYKVVENTNIGYLDINKFSENLKDQVSEALINLENQGITSLIIDMRNNAGGYLTAAEDVASLFLENGKVIYSLEANGNKATYTDKTSERRTYPIVVLINGGSASASEILAAALKDSYDNITLVGTRSYGKGKVQQVVSLSSGDSVKYTSAKWLTPLGICVDGVGISPDYNISLDDGSDTDTQLEKAIELLNK